MRSRNHDISLVANQHQLLKKKLWARKLSVGLFKKTVPETAYLIEVNVILEIYLRAVSYDRSLIANCWMLIGTLLGIVEVV